MDKKSFKTLTEEQASCQQNTQKWENYAIELQEVASKYPEAMVVTNGKKNCIVTPLAEKDRVTVFCLKGNYYFQLCGGIKIDDSPTIRAIFSDKITAVDAVRALALFREKHPESFDQLRKIIEEHSEPIGSSFEVLPFIV